MNITKLIRLWLVGGALAFLFSSIGKSATEEDSLLNDYLALSGFLANDSLTEAVKAASRVSDLADAKSKTDPKTYKDIAASSKSLVLAKSLDDARATFKTLSEAMKVWFIASRPANIEVMFCSMKKAYWLQAKGQPTRNPYYGKEMLTCGYPVTKKL